MTLQEKLDKIIEEDEPYFLNSDTWEAGYDRGYYQALKDFRDKKPEIIKAVLEEVEKKLDRSKEKIYLIEANMQEEKPVLTYVDIKQLINSIKDEPN